MPWTPHRVWLGPAWGLRYLFKGHGDRHKRLGIYEIELAPWYRRYLRPGVIVYDIGAGDGDTTLLFAKLVRPKGMVIAFEPRQDNLDRLQANRDLNRGKLADIVIIPKYVGSEGTDALQTRVDDVAKTIIPGFVKIDVDGWEMEVLFGMIDTLQVHRPIVVVETHSQDLEKQCAGLLTCARYSVRIIPPAWWRIGPFKEGRAGKQVLPDGTLTDGTYNAWMVGIPIERQGIPVL